MWPDFASFVAQIMPCLLTFFRMKNKVLLLATVLFAFLSLAFVRNKPTRIVFFGDSITQQGVGPTGYITQMGKLLTANGLASQYELIGAGVGGNKIYDLYLRLEDDVLAKKPDVVVMYIGINDVWHKASHGTGTDPAKFVKFYQAIIKKLKAQGIKVVLCTPTVIGERKDSSNQQDGDLNHYGNLIRDLAVQEELQLCDLRKIFIDFLGASNPNNVEKEILTTDRVHLNEKGNEIVAKAMMDILVKK